MASQFELVYGNAKKWEKVPDNGELLLNPKDDQVVIRFNKEATSKGQLFVRNPKGSIRPTIVFGPGTKQINLGTVTQNGYENGELSLTLQFGGFQREMASYILKISEESISLISNDNKVAGTNKSEVVASIKSAQLEDMDDLKKDFDELNNSNIERLKNDKAALESKVKELLKQKTEFEPEVNKLLEQRAYLNKKINEELNPIIGSIIQLERVNSDISELESKINNLKDEIDMESNEPGEISENTNENLPVTASGQNDSNTKLSESNELNTELYQKQNERQEITSKLISAGFDIENERIRSECKRLYSNYLKLTEEQENNKAKLNALYTSVAENIKYLNEIDNSDFEKKLKILEIGLNDADKLEEIRVKYEEFKKDFDVVCEQYRGIIGGKEDENEHELTNVRG